MKAEAPHRQNWTLLNVDDPVTIVDAQGHTYGAVIDDKMPDSSVVWIRRTDINTRHLFECRGNVRILRWNSGLEDEQFQVQ